MRASLRLPPTADWLPEFCQASTLLGLMLITQAVVLVAVLAPGHDGDWTTLSVSTVFAQWLALSSAALLCQLRSLLLKLAPWWALLGVLGAVGANAFALSWLAYVLDQALALNFTEPVEQVRQFVGGVMALSLILTLAALRYSYVHVQWRRQVEAQARTALDALTARIRPHFLFNSMNSIAALVRSEPHHAEQAIEDLSELFRAALKANDNWVSLEDELAMLERYLSIEELRLGPRLKIRYDVDSAPLDIRLPSLLLQPLVENAVYHGIQPMPEGGVIRIRALPEAAGVRISIENPRPDPPQPSQGHGMALNNVQLRLRYAFGARSSLDVVEGSGYYAVSLLIPRP